MRMLKLALPLVALAVAGALLVGGPAQSQTPGVGIIAKDDFFQTLDGAAANVTVAAGSIVGFSQGGTNPHNVVFKDMSPACVQTAGAPSGPVPPLPNQASSAPWSGTCTFTAPGTYAFYCIVHGTGMSGSVVVSGGTTPPPVVPPPPVSLPPPPPPPAATGPAASSLRVVTIQRGFTLRGSVLPRSAGSRLLARAFAKRRSLSGGRSNLLVAVGRQLRTSVGPTRASFSVMLSSAARRALRRNGRLAITLRLTVTPPTGTSYTATRAVILRAP